MKTFIDFLRAKKRETDNKLIKFVCSELIAYSKDYTVNNDPTKVGYATDIVTHGCSGGSWLVWEADLDKVFKRYCIEILDYIDEFTADTGEAPKFESFNSSFICWWVFEVMTADLLNEFTDPNN